MKSKKGENKDMALDRKGIAILRAQDENAE